MYRTATIDELIQDGKTAELSYRNIHTTAKIEDLYTRRIIEIPYMSLVNKYISFFQTTIFTWDIAEKDKLTYRYKPKALSLDLYGTTELWCSLLEINNLISVVEFTLDSPIKIFDPKKIDSIINEVLILEGVLS